MRKQDRVEVVELNVAGNRRNWQSVIGERTQRKWCFRKVSLAEAHSPYHTGAERTDRKWRMGEAVCKTNWMALVND